jgi:hypothetical protein
MVVRLSDLRVGKLLIRSDFVVYKPVIEVLAPCSIALGQ